MKIRFWHSWDALLSDPPALSHLVFFSAPRAWNFIGPVFSVRSWGSEWGKGLRWDQKPSLELSGYQIRQGYNQRLFLSCTLPAETSTVSELKLTHTRAQTLDIVENLSPPNKRDHSWPCLGLWSENCILPNQCTLTRSCSNEFFYQANSSCLIKELAVKAENPAAINYWQSMWIRDKKKSFFLHASDSK